MQDTKLFRFSAVNAEHAAKSIIPFTVVNSGKLMEVAAPILVQLIPPDDVPSWGKDSDVQRESSKPVIPAQLVNSGNETAVSFGFELHVSVFVKVATFGVLSVVRLVLLLTVIPALETKAGKLTVVKAALVLLLTLISPDEDESAVSVNEVRPAPAVTTSPAHVVNAPRFNPVSAARVVKLSAPAVCSTDKLTVVNDAQVVNAIAPDDVKTGNDIVVRLAQEAMPMLELIVVSAGNEYVTTAVPPKVEMPILTRSGAVNVARAVDPLTFKVNPNPVTPFTPVKSNAVRERQLIVERACNVGRAETSVSDVIAVLDKTRLVVVLHPPASARNAARLPDPAPPALTQVATSVAGAQAMVLVSWVMTFELLLVSMPS